MQLQKIISKTLFLVAIFKVTEKLAGSGSRSGVGSEFRVRSESVSQRYRSADLDPDPDPYQSFTDPKNLFVLIKLTNFSLEDGETDLSIGLNIIIECGFEELVLSR
jgi:hypothetical protein